MLRWCIEAVIEARSIAPDLALPIFSKTMMAKDAGAFAKNILAKLPTLALILLLTACKSRPPLASDLRARIAATNTSQYCHKPDACFNPSILAIETGYMVTVFVGNKAQGTTLRTEALCDHLLSLPMSAWPEAPRVVISPSDDVYDPQAVYKNLKEAEQVCRSLDLDVETRPGG